MDIKHCPNSANFGVSKKNGKWPKLVSTLPCAGIPAAVPVPRPVDPDPGWQGALSRGGAGVQRQDEQSQVSHGSCDFSACSS